MQNCWQILGIEPIDDEKTIKHAYAKQLKTNRPDKNPDGFKQLRAAYEQALIERHWIVNERLEDSLDNDYANNAADEYEENTNSETLFEQVNSETAKETPEQSEPNKAEFNEGKSQPTHSNEVPKQQNINDLKTDETTNPKNLNDVHHYNDDNSTASNNDNYNFNNLDSNNIEDTQVYTHKQNCDDTDTNIDDEQNNPNFNHNFDSNIDDHDINDSYDGKLKAWENEWDATCLKQLKEDQPNHVNDNDNDEQLCTVLQKQFDELNQLPLDTHTEFEYQLIRWFDNNELTTPESFKLATKHFNWQARLHSWESEHYPWSIVRNIANGYSSIARFNTSQQFGRYLAHQYPTINQYIRLEEGTNKEQDKLIDPPKIYVVTDFILDRLLFLRYFLSPYNAYMASNELKHLDNELDYAAYQHSNNETYVNRWQNHPQIKNLRQWLWGWFINRKLFVFLFLLSFAITIFASLIYGLVLKDHIRDFWGIVTVLVGFVLLWQLQIKSFCSNISEDYKKVIKIFTLVNAVIGGLFYGKWLQDKQQIINQQLMANNGETQYWSAIFDGLNVIPMSYTAAHVFAGISSIALSIILSRRSITVLYRYWILIAILVILILPNLGKIKGADISLYYSPLIWVFMALPVALLKLSELKSWLSFIHIINRIYIGFAFIMTFSAVIAVGSYCMQVLPALNLPITASILSICLTAYSVAQWHGLRNLN